MAKNKIVIEVEGGVVQEVYVSDPETQVTLIDWDTEGVLDKERLVEVEDAGGNKLLVWATEFPTAGLDDMPTDTNQAADRAR